MNLGNFLKTFHRTMDENKFNRRAILALIAANVLLVVTFLLKGQTIVMIPPDLDKQGSISASVASDEVLESWGLFYATLMGNLTPKNAPFLLDNLSKGVTPALYHDVEQSIQAQVKQIVTEDITTRFTPANSFVDPKSGHVFVSGELVTQGVRNTSEREPRTFEFSFVVRRYRVLLDAMQNHKGDYHPGPQEKQS